MNMFNKKIVKYVKLNELFCFFVSDIFSRVVIKKLEDFLV